MIQGKVEGKMESKLDRTNSRLSSIPETSVDDGGEKKANTSTIVLKGTPILDIKACRPQFKKVGVDLPLEARIDVEQQTEIDGGAEDIFTLESFRNLIMHSYRHGKAFILARVMTIDPGPNYAKCYWSDYAAHHINKILYRTELEKNLLHRMRCRNPLNNMIIVGRVNYYAITPEAVSRSHLEYEKRTGERMILESRVLPWESGAGQGNVSQVSVALSEGSLQKASISGNHKKSYSETALDLIEAKKTSRRSFNLEQKETLIESNSEAHRDLQRNSMAADAHKNSSPEQVIIPIEQEVVAYEAKFVGTDDDFMNDADFREFIEINAVNKDDAKLFQLYPEGNTYYIPNLHAGSPLEETQQPATAANIIRPRRLKNLWGALIIPPINSIALRGTGFIERKFFLIFSVIYIGGLCALCLLVLPDIMAFSVGVAMGLAWVIMFLFFMAWP
jgi:hypothetical protein